MTTIAYKDGVLAADTQVTNGDKAIFYDCKIGRRGAVLFASSGSGCWGRSFKDWIRSGCVGNAPISSDKEAAGTGVIIGAGKIIEFWPDGEADMSPVGARAWGSGRDIALGAMRAGASAADAVRAALDFDIYTGGSITVLSPH